MLAAVVTFWLVLSVRFATIFGRYLLHLERKWLTYYYGDGAGNTFLSCTTAMKLQHTKTDGMCVRVFLLIQGDAWAEFVVSVRICRRRSVGGLVSLCSRTGTFNTGLFGVCPCWLKCSSVSVLLLSFCFVLFLFDLMLWLTKRSKDSTTSVTHIS